MAYFITQEVIAECYGWQLQEQAETQGALVLG